MCYFSCLNVTTLQDLWGREQYTFRVVTFIFPRNHYMWCALLSWKRLNTCLPIGSNEWICCLVLLYLHMWLLLYLVNCLYLSPCIFTLLPFEFSPPSYLERVNKQLCGVQLPAGVKTHHLHHEENLKVCMPYDNVLWPPSPGLTDHHCAHPRTSF